MHKMQHGASTSSKIYNTINPFSKFPQLEEAFSVFQCWWERTSIGKEGLKVQERKRMISGEAGEEERNWNTENTHGIGHRWGGRRLLSLPGEGRRSTDPAAPGFVGLVVAVKQFEPVHHHTQFWAEARVVSFHLSIFASAGLWNWSRTQEKGNCQMWGFCKQQGQTCLTCIWRVLFCNFFLNCFCFGVLGFNQESWPTS